MTLYFSVASTGGHTVQVGRPHERDVHAHVSMIRGAIEAQIDAKGNGRPCRVLCAAIETYLFRAVRMGDCRLSVWRARAPRTLFADFAFSLAKMFWDSVFVASAMVATDSNNAGVAVGVAERRNSGEVCFRGSATCTCMLAFGGGHVGGGPWVLPLIRSFPCGRGRGLAAKSTCTVT
jgi:hypothetical protein